MLKILQGRLQPYVNHGLLDVQLYLERQRSQSSNCQHPLYHWKSKEFQKNIYFCFIDYNKAFDCVDPNKLWKSLQEMSIPDHFTCLLRNLYADQEATRHGATVWFKIGKGVRQGCILSPWLFNTYEECIMQNAGMDEAQGRIKIARRNISNLRYADDNHPYGKKQRTKETLDDERGEWKSWLKTQDSEN